MAVKDFYSRVMQSLFHLLQCLSKTSIIRHLKQLQHVCVCLLACLLQVVTFKDPNLALDFAQALQLTLMQARWPSGLLEMAAFQPKYVRPK